MSRVDFELNLPGLNELMRGPEMQTILSDYGNAIMGRANSAATTKDATFSAETKALNWIAVTNVRADNGAAIKDNLNNNTLLKALGG